MFYPMGPPKPVRLLGRQQILNYAEFQDLPYFCSTATSGRPGVNLIVHA